MPNRTELDVYAAAGDRARDRARSSITELVRETAGTDAIHEVPIWPGANTTEQRPTPLHGLRAALRLRDETAGHARRFVEELRADGASWPEVATEVRRHDEDVGGEGVEAVFEEFATDGSTIDASWMSWRCSSCTHRVMDYGPYNPHPADAEHGHADTCTRHTDAIRTYEQQV